MHRSVPWLSVAFLAVALLAVPAPTQAGTADAPEITDPTADQAVGGTVPACPAGGGTQCAAGTRVDAQKVWIDTETADTFNVNILLSNVPAGAASAHARWEFHATFGGTEVISVATGLGGQNANPPPVPAGNVASASVSGNTLILTIAKSVYGAPAAGSMLENMFYFGQSQVPPPAPGTPTYITDRAPNTGGATYTFTGAGVAGNASDTDADGLNDTWEQEQFGNLTQNGTADPDADGLNNTQEFAQGTNATNPDTDGDGLLDGEEFEQGTNPLVADSDGDGASDGEEVDAGTDPNDPNETPPAGDDGNGTDDGDGGGDGTDGGDDDGPLEGDEETGGDGDGRPTSLDEAVDRVAEEEGYALASGAGMGAVVVLSILGLAARWGV